MFLKVNVKPQEEKNFNLTCDSKFLAIPPAKTLYNEGGGLVTSTPENQSENQIKIPLLFQHPYPNYQTSIEMRSKDWTDIRTYVLTMQINPKPVKAKIEMRVSAGESIH